MVTTIPSRETMVKDIQRKNLTYVALPEVAKLFNLMENESHHPANFSKEASAILEKICEQYPDYKKYSEMVKVSIGIRLIEKVGQYYDRVKLDKLKQWLPPNTSDADCENLIVACSKAGKITASINNDNKTVTLSKGSNKSQGQILEFSGLKTAVEMINRETNAEEFERARTRMVIKIIQNLEDDKKEAFECMEILKKERDVKYKAQQRELEIERGMLGHVDIAAEKKKKEIVKKQKKDIEKERLNKNINQLTEQKKQKLKNVILKIKPNIKAKGKRLSSIPVSEITLKELEDLKEFIGKSEEKSLTEYIKKEVRHRDVLVRAYREEEGKLLLPEWEKHTTMSREIEEKVTQERKKEYDEVVAALSPQKEIKKIMEEKFKEIKKKEYQEKLAKLKHEVSEKYRKSLMDIAKEKYEEEKKRKEEEEQHENEMKLTRDEIETDKQLKEKSKKTDMFDGELGGDIKITRSSKPPTEAVKPTTIGSSGHISRTKEDTSQGGITRAPKEEVKAVTRQEKKKDYGLEEIKSGTNWRSGQKETKKEPSPTKEYTGGFSRGGPEQKKESSPPKEFSGGFYRSGPERKKEPSPAKESSGGFTRGGPERKKEPSQTKEYSGGFTRGGPKAESFKKEDKKGGSKKTEDKGFSFRK